MNRKTSSTPVSPAGFPLLVMNPICPPYRFGPSSLMISEAEPGTKSFLPGHLYGPSWHVLACRSWPLTPLAPGSLEGLFLRIWFPAWFNLIWVRGFSPTSVLNAAMLLAVSIRVLCNMFHRSAQQAYTSRWEGDTKQQKITNILAWLTLGQSPSSTPQSENGGTKRPQGANPVPEWSSVLLVLTRPMAHMKCQIIQIQVPNPSKLTILQICLCRLGY